MRVEILPDPAAAAQRTAELIAEYARRCVSERGRFVMALSGGTEPWEAFRRLARLDVPWRSVLILQVDERVAPPGDSARNLTHLRESLFDRVALSPDQVHPMPVEEPDLEAAANRYAALLARLCGSPAAIDLVHLGLGEDGHTASLVPGDPVLEASGDVAVTQEYRGHRRMTLTFPALERARRIVWLVPGARKADALEGLLRKDTTLPGARVSQARAILVADRAAAAKMQSSRAQ